MGFQILDGKGRGFLAEVNSSNEVAVRAVTFTDQHNINSVSGKVWTVSFEAVNPTAADDYVFYFTNTGDSNLEIESIRLSVDTAASQIELHKVTGTAVGGSNITPVSRNLGSGALPSATIQSGVDITGLTSAGILYFIQCPVVATDYELIIDSAIIMPKGTAVALLVETGTANLTGVITILEE